ncbi:Unknown protein [Striga hermonthica]|uniref:Uncharacterized protein n=1 Tax=Striga hermonthica TaxID=68872 RepID=A0A9N7MQV2_STRHE|nr:Unknown protein [Striga hermonthica]
MRVANSLGNNQAQSTSTTTLHPISNFSLSIVVRRALKSSIADWRSSKNLEVPSAREGHGVATRSRRISRSPSATEGLEVSLDLRVLRSSFYPPHFPVPLVSRPSRPPPSQDYASSDDILLGKTEKMRRQGGHYGGDSDSGRGDGGGHRGYGGSAAQMHQQHPSSKSSYYHGRHQEQQTLGEKEGGSQHNNQWLWERDGAQDKLPQTAMSPTAPFSEGREAPRSYYQTQRLDPRMPMERQGGGDPRDQSQEEDMDIGYDDNHVIQTFEGLEQRFLDDILKLSKEQVDAEDAENARHRERINTINAQYEEQLLALRARHATRRDEFLQKESVARQQQYQQIFMEFNPVAASAGESHIGYNSEPYDSYSERTRFPGGARDHRYESKVPYPKGRAYNNDSGSHYY